MPPRRIALFVLAASLVVVAPVFANPDATDPDLADTAPAIIAPAAAAAAAASPPAVASDAEDWIRPEDVVDRADLLGRRLESRRAGSTIVATVNKIRDGITRLDPELEAGFEQAKVALAGQSSLMAIQDARRELEGSASSFASWRSQLEAEAKRVTDVLAELDEAQRRWTRTLQHPETAQAGEAVLKRVQSTLVLLGQASEELKQWRVNILALNDRLLDRSNNVDETLDRLQAATLAEGASLVIADHPPLWKRELAGQLAAELPQVPQKYADFQHSTTEYVTSDERPFILQLLVGIFLMLTLRRLPEGARRRMSQSDVSSETLRLLQAPYSVALLLTLTLSPAMHPTAPHRVMQFLGLLTLFPVARVLMLANRRSNVSLYIGLCVLLVLDRLAIALSALPALTLILFLVELGVALALAFEYRRRLVASGGSAWVIRLLSIGMGGVVVAFVAETGGWSSLAGLLGRGILISGIGALYVYAAMISIEALFAYALASPALRSSLFVDRNQRMVQRWMAAGLRLIATVYWLRLLVNSLGLRDVAADGLDAVLDAGVTVGALSLSIGGVLAFGLTIAVSMFISRLVHELLEDEIFPRANMPRGLPNALLTLTNYGIYSLGFVLALAAAGVQLGQLSIMLGGLGVGIGLGLQDVVKNFAGGITILLERRLHVGDAVEIPEKNVFGRILSIGMRASVVRNWNGTEVVMPNDDLVAGTVTNWTLSDAYHRLEVPVGVSYGSDPEHVLAILMDVARADTRLLTTPPPAALFLGFGESTLNFSLRAWSDEQYETAATRTSELGVAVNKALRAAGIEISFPQRDLHLASVSEQAGAALRGAADAG
jgi:small-conductance mechanosensitive channel